MNRAVVLLLVLLATLAIGCEKSPYMNGYQEGHKRGRWDLIQQRKRPYQVVPPNSWERKGRKLSTYFPDSVEHRDFEQGYHNGYDDVHRRVWNPRPPE